MRLMNNARWRQNNHGKSEPQIMTAEEWRDIAGHIGHAVSNLGAVRGPSGLRRLSQTGNGYLSVKLTLSNRTTTHSVHSLVAAAFIGPRPAGMEIDHIDRCRTNNAAANLRYVTRLENMANSEPKTGARNGRARLTEAQALEILALPRARKRGKGGSLSPYSVRSIAARFNVGLTTIADLIKGKTWPHLNRSEPNTSRTTQFQDRMHGEGSAAARDEGERR